jgi:hypothetical protein
MVVLLLVLLLVVLLVVLLVLLVFLWIVVLAYTLLLLPVRARGVDGRMVRGAAWT